MTSIISSFLASKKRINDRLNKSFDPAYVEYVPYIHAVIACIVQIILFGSMGYYTGANISEVLVNSTLAKSLSESATLKMTELACVSIGCPLLLELMVDVTQSIIAYRNKTESIRTVSARAKEWTVRMMFLVALMQPGAMLLSANNDRNKIVMAYTTAFAKNITFVCMGVFSLTNTFDKTPMDIMRSLFLSVGFATGQLMMHFDAIGNSSDPNQISTLAMVGTILSVIPLFMYMYYCFHFAKLIFLKTRREGGLSNVTLREHLFLMYSLATGLGIIVTLIVVFGFNSLIYYNSSLEVLATYDISIMVYALLATLVPARIARLEARTLQAKIDSTKRSVTENLSDPLNKVYLGLDRLLRANTILSHLDEKELMNLSAITLACNEALRALEGLTTYRTERGSDGEGDTESRGSHSRKSGFADMDIEALTPSGGVGGIGVGAGSGDSVPAMERNAPLGLQVVFDRDTAVGGTSGRLVDRAAEESLRRANSSSRPQFMSLRPVTTSLLQLLDQRKAEQKVKERENDLEEDDPEVAAIMSPEQTRRQLGNRNTSNNMYTETYEQEYSRVYEEIDGDSDVDLDGKAYQELLAKRPCVQLFCAAEMNGDLSARPLFYSHSHGQGHANPAASSRHGAGIACMSHRRTRATGNGSIRSSSVSVAGVSTSSVSASATGLSERRQQMLSNLAIANTSTNHTAGIPVPVGNPNYSHIPSHSHSDSHHTRDVDHRYAESVFSDEPLSVFSETTSYVASNGIDSEHRSTDRGRCRSGSRSHSTHSMGDGRKDQNSRNDLSRDPPVQATEDQAALSVQLPVSASESVPVPVPMINWPDYESEGSGDTNAVESSIVISEETFRHSATYSVYTYSLLNQPKKSYPIVNRDVPGMMVPLVINRKGQITAMTPKTAGAAPTATNIGSRMTVNMGGHQLLPVHTYCRSFGVASSSSSGSLARALQLNTTVINYMESRGHINNSTGHKGTRNVEALQPLEAPLPVMNDLSALVAPTTVVDSNNSNMNDNVAQIMPIGCGVKSFAALSSPLAVRARSAVSRICGGFASIAHAQSIHSLQLPSSSLHSRSHSHSHIPVQSLSLSTKQTDASNAIRNTTPAVNMNLSGERNDGGQMTTSANVNINENVNDGANVSMSAVVDPNVDFMWTLLCWLRRDLHSMVEVHDLLLHALLGVDTDDQQQYQHQRRRVLAMEKVQSLMAEFMKAGNCTATATTPTTTTASASGPTFAGNAGIGTNTSKGTTMEVEYTSRIEASCGVKSTVTSVADGYSHVKNGTYIDARKDTSDALRIKSGSHLMPSSSSSTLSSSGTEIDVLGASFFKKAAEVSMGDNKHIKELKKLLQITEKMVLKSKESLTHATEFLVALDKLIV